jgi:hypothetical protein
MASGVILKLMLKLSANLHNLGVVSLRSSGTVAIAIEPIINPHNLKIIGWWCKVPAHSDPRVLLLDDVRDHLPKGLAIDDEEDLTDPEDLVRHKQILDINFRLAGKPVKTKRTKLGKVSDFSYNDGMFVQKLYVERPITKILSADETLLIDRNQIIEVTDNYILVKDSEIEASEGELSRAAVPAS